MDKFLTEFSAEANLPQATCFKYSKSLTDGQYRNLDYSTSIKSCWRDIRIRVVIIIVSFIIIMVGINDKRLWFGYDNLFG